MARLRLGGRLALLLALTACSSVTVPRLESPPAERRIVVVVPGITGVELTDPDTGKAVWGRGVDLLFPRDGGYRLAAEDLVPGRAIRRIRLGPVVKPVYAPIERLFVANGWSLGDLRHPSGDADLFFFAYDWRHGNSRSAVELGRELVALARERGSELPVSLVCQSNGAHICRYLAKYGTASLEEAEHGVVERLEGVHVEQLVLVGTANGGSLRILRFLNQGRRYVPLVGRHFRPELFFTFESLYQDLPTYQDDLFLDPEGRALAVDLFDAATWKTYGWSIYSDSARRHLARREASEVFPEAEERDAFLARALDRARRFRSLLDRDVDIGDTRYYSIQNDRIPTPARAVLRATAGRAETLFPGDARIPAGLEARLTAPGDGHATKESERWLTATETDALAAPVFDGDGPHFEMILEPDVLESLLAICAEPRPVAGRTDRTARPSGAQVLHAGPGRRHP